MLAAEGLVKRFGALEATRDVSFALEPGARAALIGPNGAGKSTLFALLAGALRPDAGRVRLGGVDVTRRGPAARAQAGLGRSFQKNALFEGLTVAEHFALAEIAASGGAWRLAPRAADGAQEETARARMAARAAGLEEAFALPARALSYGLKRQLEIGLALVARPKVLLLDEPTAGMGPEETARTLRLLSELPRDMAVLLVEHDMDLVFDWAERVMVLDAGALIFDGAPAAALRSEAVREVYLGPAPEAEAGAAEGRS